MAQSQFNIRTSAELIKEIKISAATRGESIQDRVSDLLRKALAAERKQKGAQRGFNS